MRQSRSSVLQLQQPEEARIKSADSFLYAPLDFVMVRTPLLPVEAYLALGDTPGSHEMEGNTHAITFEDSSLLPCDPRIREALAIGSSALWDDLKRSSPSSKDAYRLKRKLLRFLIRMSTRPTPYGLFAGVALGQWGQKTDLAVAAESPFIRTRPDMAWLLALVREIESLPAVREQLHLVANPTAFVCRGRIYMPERLPIGESTSAFSVSIRATEVVKRALSMARQPIFYQDLMEALLSTTPGATPEKVEQLITELWQQTLLLTDLRPPLTIDSPAQYVMQRLTNIPAAREYCIQLQAVLDTVEIHDAATLHERPAIYQRLMSQINAMSTAALETPVQVDMAIPLRGQHIAQMVGAEAARAAELLLKMTPFPRGSLALQTYRQAFISRYGQSEVPLLELLDPNCNLDMPTTDHSSSISPAKAALRAQTLLQLAFNALQSRSQIIELDNDTLTCLETWPPSSDTAPISLDINFFISSRSAEALDAGEFRLIIGPNIGAQAAGRNLGRFADVIGFEAFNALKKAAQAEAIHAPDRLWVELVYLPYKSRLANVAIHPAIRDYEIVIGTNPGVSTNKVIPLHELAVGIRNNRFYIRWVTKNRDIIVNAGHMLTSMQAPGICRFLAEISRDGIPLLSSFDWGPASQSPFLPRVQVGRVILCPAQWRLEALICARTFSPDSPRDFRKALRHWREQWQTPQYVYLSQGDNRLLLNLENASQIEELRTEIRRMREGGYIVLQEVLPQLDQVWLEGPEGHYMAEFVSSLIFCKNQNQIQSVSANVSPWALSESPFPVKPTLPTLSSQRLRTPGSEWLFIKLYCTSQFEEDLIAYHLRPFAQEIFSAGGIKEWFFIRYRDPDQHIRFRLRGDPKYLVEQLFPLLCAWANKLVAAGICLRFAFDTYDREIERYGGASSIHLAETVFAIDSSTVSAFIYLIQKRAVQMDRISLAVLSVDNLLASLGLSELMCLQWLRQHVTSRNQVGQEYRQGKILLRSLLGDPHSLLNEPEGTSLMQLLMMQRTTLAPVAGSLLKLAEQGELNQTLNVLYQSFVHMHCNRLFGLDQHAEPRVLGLLLRTREGLYRSSNG